MVKSVQNQKDISEVADKVIKDISDEQQFLKEFRGEKGLSERKILFDLLGCNLWRNKRRSGSLIANKIIKLYQMK